MVKPRRTHRHVAPSRTRYEAGHPTVTVRVDRALYDNLKALKDTAGLSMADVLKVGLEKAQPDLEAAYHQGYEEAEAEYKVTYWCAHCRERHMVITTDAEKEAACKLMYQAGWYNPKCPVRSPW